MTKRVVLAGASGFIGSQLVEHYAAQGAQVFLIGRNGPDARWGDGPAIAALIDGANIVINMAGKSVNCRYTSANRKEILRSRVDTTAELATAIAMAKRPPALWINSSTATIYRHSIDAPQTESTGELGSGFSVEIARAWEEAFFARDLPSTRRVALRTAIVIGDGSVMVPLSRLARVGLGGAHLDGKWFAGASRRAAGTFHEFGVSGGRQKFSWVHMDDVLGVINFVEHSPHIDGVINVSSPNPTDNRGFMATLRTVVRAPFGMPLQRWMLELGSAIIRTETELVLKSRWVLPERLLAEGYVFRYPELEPAVRAAL